MQSILEGKKYKWFLTGVAGFIGSNILQYLLENDQEVVAVDNFSTGHKKNIEDVVSKIPDHNLKFYEVDIRNFDEILKLSKGADIIIHQAALGSVPRSIDNPIATNDNNVVGTLNIFYAAVKNNIKKVVYASSSSVYGDHSALPKVESVTGNSLSPYASSKRTVEIYANSFSNCYDVTFVGLRYFNVFGRRQDPNGPYAAVISKWIEAVVNNKEIYINGDGETSRDFTYVDNIVQLNIRAAISTLPKKHMVFNGAYGQRITLTQLYENIIQNLGCEEKKVYFREFRHGDVRHSLANIDLAKSVLGYQPTHDVYQGLRESVDWYVKNLKR